MYRNILVPVEIEHSGRGEHAIQVARQLLDAGGTITVLHVMEEVPGYAAGHLPEDLVAQSRQNTLQELREMGDRAGGGVTARLVRGHASRAILDHAASHGIDCIVIASHKPGLEDYFLGSTAARVVRHAGCSVHVIR